MSELTERLRELTAGAPPYFTKDRARYDALFSAATALERVEKLAEHYEGMAAELPEPHGVVTQAFTSAARSIRDALEGK